MPRVRSRAGRSAAQSSLGLRVMPGPDDVRRAFAECRPRTARGREIPLEEALQDPGLAIALRNLACARLNRRSGRA